jgi:RimJ/RimL family protein N-acetyltransferase
MAASFNFSQHIILEDERLELRPLQHSDVEHLLEISLNEPETWEYSLVKANGKENLINYIQLAVAARDSQTQFPFIVFDK